MPDHATADRHGGRREPAPEPAHVAARWRCLAAWSGHLIVSLVLTWPLALHPRSIPLGTERVRTVPLFNLWTLAWTADRLPHGLAGWWDAPIFWPQRGAFAYSEPQLPTGVAFAAARLLVRDDAVALTVVLLGLFTLNGVAAAALARALGAARAEAWTIGVLAQAVPFSAHELGVLQLLAQAPLLATMAALVRWRDDAGLRRSLAVGAAASLTALACGYYGIALTIPFGLVPVLWWGRPPRPPLRACIGGALVAGGVAALLALPVLLMQAERTRGFGWSRATVTALSVRPGELAPGGPWWPGWVVAVPAGAGVVLGRRQPAVRWLAAVAGAAALASFGPRLSLLGWRPWWTAASVVPGVDRLRNPTRFVVLLQLASVGLATPTLVRLRTAADARWARRWPGSAGAAEAGLELEKGVGGIGPGRTRGAGLVPLGALALAAVLTFPSDHRLAPVPDTPGGAARHLAGTADRDPAVALPFAPSGKVADFEATTVAMLDGLHHHHPLVNGYSGFFPDGERRLRQRLQHFPDEDSLAALRARGVRWIIADNAWLSAGAGQAAAAEPALRVAYRDQRQTLFELDAGSR